MTEGGTDKEGKFHKAAKFDDSLIAEFFSREVFSLLLREELISPELVRKVLRWRYSGFNVHSKVRATSKREAERVSKYMIRPLLSSLNCAAGTLDGGRRERRVFLRGLESKAL